MYSSVFVRFDERSSVSHIGRDDFYQGILNLFRLKYTFSKFDFWFLFKFSSFFVKRRQTPLSNSKSVKFMKNVIDFKFRKRIFFSDFPVKWKIYLLIQFSQFRLILSKKVIHELYL